MKAKKLLAVLVVLTLVIALAVPAFAAGDTAAAEATGTITVNNAKADTLLNVYKILTCSKYTNGNSTYYASYTFVKPAYKTAFIKTANDLNAGALANDATDTQVLKYVNDHNTAEFAKALAVNLKAAIASDTAITPKYTQKNAAFNEGTFTFSDVELGYYLLDDVTEYGESGAAALMLSTAAPNATVNLKHSNFALPVKTADKTSANVGDTITYTITSKISDISNFASYNFAIQDTMGAGQTFKGITSVTALKDGNNVTYTRGEAADASAYVLSGTDKHEDGTTIFTLNFGDIVANGFKAGDTITVTYTATVDSTTGSTLTNNPANLENGTTVHGNGTTVYVYGFSATKVNEDNTKLAGVGFKVSLGDSYLNFTGSNGNWTYAGTATDKDAATEITTGSDGVLNVWGLAAGTYSLEETNPLTGYNGLVSPITVVLPGTGATNGIYSVGDIVNTTGITLPSTGGMGNTLFTITGCAILAASAAYVVINRKKITDK